MSHTWREYAKTQDAPDRASKHLYMILADKARDAEFVDKRRYRHPANACWPSLPALAVEAQMSERSLNRSIGKLVEAGLIKRIRHQRRNADFIMLIRSENPSEEAGFRNAVDGVSRTQFRNAKTGRFETPPTASNIKEKEKNNFLPSSASSAREENSDFSLREKSSSRANGAGEAKRLKEAWQEAKQRVRTDIDNLSPNQRSPSAIDESELIVAELRKPGDGVRRYCEIVASLAERSAP